jgi:hypothetical protein
MKLYRMEPAADLDVAIIGYIYTIDGAMTVYCYDKLMTAFMGMFEGDEGNQWEQAAEWISFNCVGPYMILHPTDAAGIDALADSDGDDA